MVQVVENRSHVRGRVMNVAPHPTMDGYAVVDLALSDVAPVSGYANLFGQETGKVVSVNVPLEEARSHGLTAGDELSARIRRAGPQAVFAERASLAKG